MLKLETTIFKLETTLFKTILTVINVHCVTVNYSYHVKFKESQFFYIFGSFQKCYKIIRISTQYMHVILKVEKKTYK